jgi:DNA-binding NarL/FixJ family response regulator
MAAQKKIKLLIGDPRPTFREGFKLLLASERDITLVGEAEAVEQVVKKITALKPAVALLHADFFETGGRNVFLQIHRNFPQIRLLVMAMKEADEEEVRALRIANLQLVPRQTSLKQVLQQVRQADQNGVAVAPEASKGAAPPQENGEQSTGDGSPLSSRERQVVELVAQGFKNREIAQRMFISEQTVKNHLHNIFDKLGVSDRLELALYAIHKSLQGS